MEMKYVSTRGKAEAVDSAQAVLQGIAGDGGLFVPTEIPKADAAFLEELVGLSYAERAKKILGQLKKRGKTVKLSNAAQKVDY